MPPWRFQAANVGGALLWAGTLLAPGALGLEPLLGWLRRTRNLSPERGQRGGFPCTVKPASRASRERLR